MVGYWLLIAAWSLVFAASAASAGDPLSTLNDTARTVYADGRARILATAGPVILVGSELVLRHDGMERRADYTPESYTRLKQVAHLPLGVFGALAPLASGAVAADDSWRGDLDSLEAAALAARGAIAGLAALSPAQQARQYRLIDDSVAFIRSRRAAPAPDWSDLQAFTRSMAPLVLANTTDAATAQLDAIHRIVSGWRDALGEAAWRRVHVVVLGPKTPRAGNLAVQYFTMALGPDAAATRVTYAESIFDEPAALALLGVLLIDRKAGEAFFDDSGRMERDLLADAATVRLFELFGRLGTP